MSKPRAGGANFMHLPYGNAPAPTSSARKTCSPSKRTSSPPPTAQQARPRTASVQTDNSGALEVFG